MRLRLSRCQWHDDVWTAAKRQLDQLYSVEHKADSRGICIVLWFEDEVPSNKKLIKPPAGVVML